MNKTNLFQSLWALLLIALVFLFGGMLFWSLYHIPEYSDGLSTMVTQHMPNSGVKSEVTAILLNFRGYDTLLEIAVLFAALLGAYRISPIRLDKSLVQSNPVILSLTQYLVPIIILVSGYILWLGGHAAGGAFQAGAVLASAGVLLVIVRPESLNLKHTIYLNFILIMGLLVFTLIAFLPILTGGTILEYPRKWAGTMILLIEAASTLSIGFTLMLLFAGGRPPAGDN